MADLGETQLVKVDDDKELLAQNNKIQIMERKVALKNLITALDKLEIDRERIEMKKNLLNKELKVLEQRKFE